MAGVEGSTVSASYAESSAIEPRADLSKRGRNSRNKGKVWERRLVHLLVEVGVPAHRGLSQTAGATTPDVDAPGLWIECKCGKRPNPRAALAQAARDNPGGRLEVVAIHDDQETPGAGATEWVAMPLSDWLELVSEWHRGRRE